MPITLTRQQLEAYAALKWLLDPTEETRRQGRSTVLALGYLRAALAAPGEWVRVHDHVATAPNKQLDQYMLDLVVRMSREAGFPPNYIEVLKTQCKIRAPEHFRVSLEDFDTFGAREDLEFHPKGRHPRLRSRTLWDKLKDEL